MDPVALIGGITIVVCAITTHEAAHALVADKLGDPTPRLLGRITLNPLPHIDLFNTILLPLMMYMSVGWVFGGAKPVPVQLHRLRNPMRAMAIIALAGPLSNLLMAILWIGLLSLLVNTGVWGEEARGIVVLQIGILANILLMVFNLIPIPPLDGSRVVAYFLHGETRRSYMSLERVGILIILGLLIFLPAFKSLIGVCLVTTGNFLADLVHLPLSVSWFPPLR